MNEAACLFLEIVGFSSSNCKSIDLFFVRSVNRLIDWLTDRLID